MSDPAMRVLERMGPWRRLGYAAGNAGFQISERIVVVVAFYFYLPPAESDLVPLVSSEVWLGVFTTYGLARLLGGVVDSLADPVVGWGSDRSRSRLGRRRVFLIAGLGPLVGLPVALFWPPGAPGSATTWLALSALLALYYVAFTVYVGPYLALIPELAPGPAERARLSSLLAMVALPVLFYPALWLAGVGLGRELGLDTTGAIRAVVVISSAAALVLCALPILAVDEARFTGGAPAALPLGEALGTTLRNRPFVLYLVAQIFFILGVTLIGPALPYYAVVTLGRSEAWGAWLGLAYLPTVLIGFALLGPLTARFGAKRMMVTCVFWVAGCLASLSALDPALPGEPGDLRNRVVLFGALVLAGFPIAGFFVLPHVMIGQLIDLDRARTGAARAAMYFGVQGLLTKWVYAAALALLSLLFARWGNSRAEPLGVWLIGPVAATCCAISAALYLAYPERKVLEETTRARLESS